LFAFFRQGGEGRERERERARAIVVLSCGKEIRGKGRREKEAPPADDRNQPLFFVCNKVPRERGGNELKASNGTTHESQGQNDLVTAVFFCNEKGFCFA